MTPGRLLAPSRQCRRALQGCMSRRGICPKVGELPRFANCRPIKNFKKTPIQQPFKTVATVGMQLADTSFTALGGWLRGLMTSKAYWTDWGMAMNGHEAQKAVVACTPIRVAIVDDHPMFRTGVVQMFKRVDGFQIVGEGASAADAIKVAQESAPHVILLDLCMPGGGIEAAAHIARSCPEVQTIILTVSESEYDIASALQAGAWGYILKGSSGPEIVEAVHAVVEGDLYVAPRLAAHLLIKRARQTERVAEGHHH